MAKGRKTGGRQKGSLNKATAEAKTIALQFLERRTVEEIEQLWDEAKGESASKALSMWFGAQEFLIPKLGRTEVTGQDGQPIRIVRVDRAE